MNTPERFLLTVAAAAALIAPVFGQNTERRATFAGGPGGDAGKCTIEVYVDGSADVEISGDRGFLRTLSGQPAQWRRFVCSGPMPSNPADFRFSGVDGRGSMELIGDPRNSRAAVVRIQDPDGGAEGYTFDLEWRGGSFGPGPMGQPLGGDRRTFRNDVIGACQGAVRERANQQYGLRDINFGSLDASGDADRDDAIMGSFDVRRDGYSETYRFSCAMDLADGRVRRVDISQAGGADADRYDRRDDRRDDVGFACQRAAEQRIQGSGYRNVQFGQFNADNRRSDRVAGTATAQRGNNGRAYDFDFSCPVNPNNGAVGSVRVSRR